MIRKAVIPAAGFGSRFLPATKSQPKEMLPVVDKPTIHYVVEEAVASGITDILMVIGKSKRSIEEYFDRNFELEAELEAKQKTEMLEELRSISSMANIYFIWQKELKGLGDAVAHARSHIGNEPFALLLGDTILRSDTDVPVTRQLIDVYNEKNASVVSLEEVPKEKVSRYGVMDGTQEGDRLYRVHDFVEKPEPGTEPSLLAFAGRYVFTPEIFDYLVETEPGKNDEIQLTDAMRKMVSERPMYGRQIEGRRFDIGNKLDYIKTNVEFALQRDDLRGELGEFIKATAKELS
ncbi:MAG: UTP--glucose-1-phosphate uridylyltransferase GalU [Kiritimatiellales bacterium]|nr:UTP--glucose-1-phosphate uridylyltransferase GalU [Kiritimatiellales bacterium]